MGPRGRPPDFLFFSFFLFLFFSLSFPFPFPFPFFSFSFIGQFGHHTLGRLGTTRVLPGSRVHLVTRVRYCFSHFLFLTLSGSRLAVPLASCLDLSLRWHYASRGSASPAFSESLRVQRAIACLASSLSSRGRFDLPALLWLCRRL